MESFRNVLRCLKLIVKTHCSDYTSSVTMKIIPHPCYTQHVTHLLTVLFVVVGDFGHGGFHYSPLSGCFLELSGCSRSYALCFRPDYLNAASFATFAIVIASIGTGSTCY